MHTVSRHGRSRRRARAGARVAVAALWGTVALAAPGLALAQDAPTPSPASSSPSVPVGTPAPVEGPLEDPYRAQQWHLDRIGLTADRVAPAGEGQVIAIVDSGVDLGHPDLVDALARDATGAVVGWDWVDDDDVPADEFGHGTMVAGIAVARAGNGVGGVGVAPGATIMPLRVLDERGEGPTTDIAEAIDFAVEHGATVINLSLESATDVAVEDVPEVLAAIGRAVDRGIVVVAAAGNHDEPLQDFDASLGVVVVGATDRDDRRAGFSDGGRADLVMAPGVEIVSTWCRPEGAATCDPDTHNYGVADGTSFAAPQVSGLVAVLRSAGLTGAEATSRIRATATDLAQSGPDAETGLGLVSLAAALGPWPDPIPASVVVPVAPESSVAPVIPAVATPEPTVAAQAPTSLRLTAAGVVVIVALAIAIVGRGVVAQRRIRLDGTMPDLRGRDLEPSATAPRRGVTLVTTGHGAPLGSSGPSGAQVPGDDDGAGGAHDSV